MRVQSVVVVLGPLQRCLGKDRRPECIFPCPSSNSLGLVAYFSGSIERHLSLGPYIASWLIALRGSDTSVSRYMCSLQVVDT